MTRPRRWLVVALVAAAVLAACGSDGTTSTLEAADGTYQGSVVDPPTPRPSFTLTDTSGAPFDFARETDGFVTFLYFGYTSCPDICPVHLANIASALGARPDLATKVKVVMVTVDPDRDTPTVLRSYLDRFDPTFIGLRGTPEEIRAAEDAAGVPPAGRDLAADGTPKGTYGHSAAVLGYGPDDLLHVRWPFGSRQSELAHDLAQLATIARVPA